MYVCTIYIYIYVYTYYSYIQVGDDLRSSPLLVGGRLAAAAAHRLPRAARAYSTCM